MPALAQLLLQFLECLRPTLPAFPAVRFRVPAEFDEPCLVRVQCQSVRSESLAQFPQEAFRVSPLLESQHEIVGVPHDDHVASGLLRSPGPRHPLIQHVVENHVRQRR